MCIRRDFEEAQKNEFFKIMKEVACGTGDNKPVFSKIFKNVMEGFEANKFGIILESLKELDIDGQSLECVYKHTQDESSYIMVGEHLLSFSMEVNDDKIYTDNVINNDIKPEDDLCADNNFNVESEQKIKAFCDNITIMNEALFNDYNEFWHLYEGIYEISFNDISERISTNLFTVVEEYYADEYVVLDLCNEKGIKLLSGLSEKKSYQEKDLDEFLPDRIMEFYDLNLYGIDGLYNAHKYIDINHIFTSEHNTIISGVDAFSNKEEIIPKSDIIENESLQMNLLDNLQDFNTKTHSDGYCAINNVHRKFNFEDTERNTMIQLLRNCNECLISNSNNSSNACKMNSCIISLEVESTLTEPANLNNMGPQNEPYSKNLLNESSGVDVNKKEELPAVSELRHKKPRKGIFTRLCDYIMSCCVTIEIDETNVIIRA